MVMTSAGMSAAMLTRATGMGLIDQPPHFALSRLFDVVARGVTATLFDPLATVITVFYTGQPCVPPLACLGGPTLGVIGLTPSNYQTAVKTQSLFTGPSSDPFFFGIAGIVDYFAINATLTDFGAATGNGAGQLQVGGLVFDATECFDNMESEAQTEDLMVVNLAHLGGDPFGSIPDPTTGAPLNLGDLFVQADILLHAIADQLTLELLNATATLPASGSFNPIAPPLVNFPTVTTIIT